MALLWAADRTLNLDDERLTANQPVQRAEKGDGTSAPGMQPLNETKSGLLGTEPGVPLQDQQQLPADAASGVQSEIRGQTRVQTEAQPAAQGVDYDVVGHPFPVSESILAACGPLDSNHARSCTPNIKLLKEMAEEPREEPWATAAEQTIRALVELEPGTERPRDVTYTIRALECRTSICFVETASIMGGFATQLYYFEKTSGLTAQYATDSTETDASGNKVHVTLWPFVRN